MKAYTIKPLVWEEEKEVTTARTVTHEFKISKDAELNVRVTTAKQHFDQFINYPTAGIEAAKDKAQELWEEYLEKYLVTV